VDRVEDVDQRLANAEVGRVAIVGAGFAGMAAAVALAERGFKPTVFESGPVPGGRARRVRLAADAEDVSLDNGQHILIGAYRELLALMAKVGVADDALLRLPLDLRYFDGFSLRQRRLPFPLGLLAGLLLARGVPLAERLGAVRFLLALRKSNFDLPEDLPVDDLLAEHGQQGALAHYVWRPLCVSALNTPPAEASARAYLVVLRDALLGGKGASDLLLPRVDLSRLFPEAALRYVEARGGRVLVRSPVRSLDEISSRYPFVILAVGPHQLKAIAPELAPDYAYQPIYTCYLQYAQARLPWPMMGLAGGLVQWVFDRGALLGEHGRLACVISAQGDHQQLSQDELADACHRELAAALPGLPRPQWSRVIAEKRATVSCTPFLKKVAWQTALHGVYLAGDYTDPDYPPTLEAAVRSGLRAANAVLETTPG
jgi:squalene-associated FAD-dependent desaturase